MNQDFFEGFAKQAALDSAALLARSRKRLDLSKRLLDAGTKSRAAGNPGRALKAHSIGLTTMRRSMDDSRAGISKAMEHA